jgi:hypothetical protein
MGRRKIEPNYEKKHETAGYKLASHTATTLLIGQISSGSVTMILQQIPTVAAQLLNC